MLTLLGAAGCGKSFHPFGPPEPTPGCDVASLPEPVPVPSFPNGQPRPAGGGAYSVMTVSLQTRILDDQEYCDADAPSLGRIWEVGYNITANGLPFEGTGPNPFDGKVKDPHLWIFYVIHGQPNQAPVNVSVDFHAKLAYDATQLALPSAGAGAACVVRIDGTPVVHTSVLPLVGADYLRCQIDIPPSYFV